MDNPIPSSLEAESAVLGSLLIDNAQWDGLRLTPDDFYDHNNRLLFQAMLAVHDKGIATDQVTVAQELVTRGQFKEIGPLLHGTVAATPTSLHCKHYAGILRDHTMRRHLIELAGEFAGRAYTATDAEPLLREMDQAIVELRRTHGRLDVMSPRERYDRMTERYEKLRDRADDVLIPTGIAKLDELLGGGLGEGELTVIGASTSIGKTEFSRYIANQTALKHPVLFATAEMTWAGLSDRDISGLAELPLSVVRAGKYSEEVYNRIEGAKGKLITDYNLHIYPDKPVGTVTVSGITAAAEQMAARNGCRLVVVDYLQYLGSETRYSKDKSRYQEIGEMVEGLGRLAKRLECPVILVSQLNRQAGHKDRPSLSELYESGKIEQHSDLILLLYRIDAFYDEDSYAREYPKHPEWQGSYSQSVYPRGIVEIIIAKQRQGGNLAIVKARYDTIHGTYASLVPYVPGPEPMKKELKEMWA